MAFFADLRQNVLSYQIRQRQCIYCQPLVCIVYDVNISYGLGQRNVGSTRQRTSINLSEEIVLQGQLGRRDLCFSSNKATLSQSHAALTALLTAKDSTFE